MFVRTVIHILIPAIIVCPMACGTGLCEGGHSTDSAQETPLTATSTSCGCCGRHSSENDDPTPESPRPLRELPCQGVCGGAVLEKPAEVPLISLPTAAVEALPIVCIGLSSEPAGEFVPRCGGNHGRFVRAQCCSLLI